VTDFFLIRSEIKKVLAEFFRDMFCIAVECHCVRDVFVNVCAPVEDMGLDKTIAGSCYEELKYIYVPNSFS
jgi:hypothetical protein